MFGHNWRRGETVYRDGERPKTLYQPVCHTVSPAFNAFDSPDLLPQLELRLRGLLRLLLRLAERLLRARGLLPVVE